MIKERGLLGALPCRQQTQEFLWALYVAVVDATVCYSIYYFIYCIKKKNSDSKIFN